MERRARPGVRRPVTVVAVPWESAVASPKLVAVPAPPRAAIAGRDAALQEARLTAATDPDVALMLRVQAGDQAAFRDLFAKFAPRILQYARRLVGSEARAEEVTQDVFVQVFRFRLRYRPEARFATWLYTIATNLCLNELRRPERHLRVDLWAERDDEPDREGPALPDPEAVDPEAGAASRELARALEEAIGELPPKQRAALLLSRIDGLAYRDVGEAMGCSEGAVKALLFRATHALKARLREHI
jgi:RNA polymerase sigma-70 factor (ECF subfamily)